MSAITDYTRTAADIREGDEINDITTYHRVRVTAVQRDDVKTVVLGRRKDLQNTLVNLTYPNTDPVTVHRAEGAPALVTGDVIALAEQGVIDLAAQVLNAVRNRKDHPSYGYTKTGIRNTAQRLRGAIEMYALVSGQSAWIGARFLDAVTYRSPEVGDRVLAAFAAVDAL